MVDQVEELEIVVDHAAGLHLRPAALFVQTAARYGADIQIRNVTRETGFQNAKSAISVMMLKVGQGDRIMIRARGSDAHDAISALQQLINSGFIA